MAKKKAAASPAQTTGRRYWLFKSEPESYSIQHLEKEPTQTTFWDGVRNYQARNSLRDDIKVGDRVLMYHSNCDPLIVAGTMDVVKAGYPDHTAFDPNDHHYDPKSKPNAPTWFMVDVKWRKTFATPVTREQLGDDPETATMVVMQRGSRLSIQPVTEAEWNAVHRLAGEKDGR